MMRTLLAIFTLAILSRETIAVMADDRGQQAMPQAPAVTAPQQDKDAGETGGCMPGGGCCGQGACAQAATGGKPAAGDSAGGCPCMKRKKAQQQ